MGATGLVGSRLLDMFLADVTVERVVVLTRRELDIQHKRLETILCDFTHPDQYAKQLRDFDILFCCIGTTMKNAGSRDAFLEVDYHIPMRLAAMASKAGIRKFIAISSLGADPASSNFYLRTKGEMERDIDANYKFTKLAFVRPSLLLGPRKEFRLGEKFGQFFMVLFSFAMIGRFRKYRPIHDFNVAKAMISVSNSVNNQRVYESLELEWLGR